VFGEDGGSMEFGWVRGSIRDEWIQSKGNTKGGNDRIGIISESEILEKDRKRIRGE